MPPVIPYQPADLRQPEELVALIRERRGGTLLNLDRMLLHSPEFAAGWNHFLGSVRHSLSVPARLRELAICAVAILNQADYELVQHAPEFLRAGGRDSQLEALEHLSRSDFDTAEFTAAELAVINLTIEMTRLIRVSDETMQTLKAALENDRQVMEVVGIVATYNMVSRYLVALGG